MANSSQLTLPTTTAPAASGVRPPWRCGDVTLQHPGTAGSAVPRVLMLSLDGDGDSGERQRAFPHGAIDSLGALEHRQGIAGEKAPGRSASAIRASEGHLPRGNLPGIDETLNGVGVSNIHNPIAPWEHK